MTQYVARRISPHKKDLAQRTLYMKYSKLITTSFACSLLAGSAFAGDYTLVNAGKLNVTDGWHEDGSGAPGVTVTLDSGNTGGFDGDDNFNITDMDTSTGGSLDLGGATLNLSGDSSLTFNSNTLGNMILNVTGTSTFSATSGNSRLNNGFTMNYDSSATSTSASGTTFKVNQSGATVNLNSGWLKLEGGLQHGNGGLVNLNGGDLSFNILTVGNNPQNNPGSIDFKSIAGSTLSYTGAGGVITALDSLIDNGFFSIDGDSEAVSALSFRRTLNGDTLELAVIPELGTSGLLVSLTAFGWIMLRRRR